MADLPTLSGIYNINPDVAQLSAGLDNLTGTSQVKNALRLPTDYIQDNQDTLLNAAKQKLGAMSPVYARQNQIVPPQQNYQESPIPQTHISNNGLVNPDFITHIIKKNESNGNYQATNPQSTASGAYQYTDGTWNGYGGYSRAMLAPPAVQDQKFREDVAHRMLHFNGDPFKVIAAHYLPALADNPASWDRTFKTKAGRTIPSVDSYIHATVRGTPLEQSFKAYRGQP